MCYWSLRCMKGALVSMIINELQILICIDDQNYVIIIIFFISYKCIYQLGSIANFRVDGKILDLSVSQTQIKLGTCKTILGFSKSYV